MGTLSRILQRISRLSGGRVLFIWSLLLLLPFLGTRRLWLPDEGRYAEVAREMNVSGNWLTPQLDFSPHFTKPPLTYWLTAAAMSVMGKNEFAARFFTALALAGTAVLVSLLAAELGRRRAAFLAGLIFLTSLVPFIAGNVLTTDMQLTFWETAAVWLFWRRHSRYPEGRFSLVGAYAALGLAFMTKGPVGVLVPLLAFAGLSAYRRDLSVFRRIASLAGLAIFACIAFPWYLAVAAVHPGLMSYFLGNEIAGRVLTTVHHRNNTFLIYPLVLTMGMIPWTLFQLRAIRNTFSWTAVRKRLLAPGDMLLGSWVLLPLIFFCLVKSRLPLYVLNLFVPLAIITAGFIRPERGDSEDRPVRRAPETRPFLIALVTSIFLAGIAVAAAFLPSRQNIHPIIERINECNPAPEYRLYSTEKGLYTLNFYTGKRVLVLSDPTAFVNETSPAFLVTRKNLPAGVLRGGVSLAAERFGYRLYYHAGREGGFLTP